MQQAGFYTMDRKRAKHCRTSTRALVADDSRQCTSASDTKLTSTVELFPTALITSPFTCERKRKVYVT